MPKNPAKSTDTAPPGSKGAFIRKHHDKSVKDIVELGKKAGLTIKESFIYNIRSADKKATGKPAHKQAGKKAAANGHAGKRAASTPATDVDAGVKSQLRHFVLRVGLDRAPQVFEQVLSDLKREVDAST